MLVYFFISVYFFIFPLYFPNNSQILNYWFIYFLLLLSYFFLHFLFFLCKQGCDLKYNMG